MVSPTPPYAAQRAPAPTTSPSVRTAVMLMYALLAVIALRALLSLVAHDALLDAFAESRNRDRSSEFDRQVIDSSAPKYTAIALGSLVIFGILLTVTATFVRRGAGWARVVATVVAALNLLNVLVAIVQPAPIWYKLLAIVVAVLAAGILVLLYRPDANEFFRRSKGHPAG